MTPATTADIDAPCPPAPAAPTTRPALSSQPGHPANRATGLVALHRAFDTIDPATWDRLADLTPCATPFARWAFHRAWWDGYGPGAHDETLVVLDPSGPDPDEPIAIVPLMHRHAVEPSDAARRTTMRGDHADALTPVGPSSRAIFFGASYHADYATVLSPPGRIDDVAGALARALARSEPDDGRHVEPWDVVDLRRLRCGDPVVDALGRAFEAVGEPNGWTVQLDREDVCPVISIDEPLDFEGYLGTLGKKERHEIRRKIRRAESFGEVRLAASEDPIGDLDAFIDLHQKRWGADGLFPPTGGGESSRTFFRRLFELFGPTGTIRLSFLTVGDRRIAAGVWFDDGRTLYYYNAGVEPEARDLSPGVNLVASSLREAIALGRRRFDFLRGDEGYKYEWGAVDEPIQRILVRRT